MPNVPDGDQQPAPRRSRGCVLIVDDSEDAQIFFSACLQRHGYTAASARDGQEALRFLLDRPLPRAIVLDLHMPTMNGVEFLGVLRSYRRVSQIPVIVVSAADASNCEAVSAVLRKPVDEDDFMRSLTVAIGG